MQHKAALMGLRARRFDSTRIGARWCAHSADGSGTFFRHAWMYTVKYMRTRSAGPCAADRRSVVWHNVHRQVSIK